MDISSIRFSSQKSETSGVDWARLVQEFGLNKLAQHTLDNTILIESNINGTRLDILS